MISLLHPSRGRPQQSFKNAKEWIEMAGCEVELIVSIDESDPSANKYYGAYEPYNHPQHRVQFLQKENKSVVEATNKAAENATGDILLYLSDDFKCFDNWGGGGAERIRRGEPPPTC